MNETLTWIACDERLPDDCETVLIVGGMFDEAWPGYYEDGQWHLADAMPVEGDITHWAPMPRGPE